MSHHEGLDCNTFTSEQSSQSYFETLIAANELAQLVFPY